MKKLVFFPIVALLAGAAMAHALETRIVVTAKAKDAKFIGTSMGGALVVVRDSATGAVLRQGTIAGSTGDTKRIMQEPLRRGMALSDEKSARFEARLDIDEPLLATVEVYAPLAQRQAAVQAQTQIWLIPGKDMAGSGDGIMLEIPGFAVDVLLPQAHEKIKLSEGSAHLTVRANVVMMCGCPIEPGGIWDAGACEVTALVKHNGQPLTGFALPYAGTASTFEGRIEVRAPGIYEIIVYAYAPATGNTGLDRTAVVVE